jgi:hypothetical protein
LISPREVAAEPGWEDAEEGDYDDEEEEEEQEGSPEEARASPDSPEEGEITASVEDLMPEALTFPEVRTLTRLNRRLYPQYLQCDHYVAQECP